MGDPWTQGTDSFLCPLQYGELGVRGGNVNGSLACPFCVGGQYNGPHSECSKTCLILLEL
jgi:hypothetical protein